MLTKMGQGDAARSNADQRQDDKKRSGWRRFLGKVATDK